MLKWTSRQTKRQTLINRHKWTQRLKLTYRIKQKGMFKWTSRQTYKQIDTNDYTQITKNKWTER